MDDLNHVANMLSMAYAFAIQSPDPSTQVGAVLVTRDGNKFGACNTFPNRVAGYPERLVRPLKYEYVEHAERNAIYAAARYGSATEGGVLYAPWFACMDCARAIIQAGVVLVVGHRCAFTQTPDQWRDNIDRAHHLLEEAGVQLMFHEDALDADPIRFNGEEWRP